MPVAVMLNIEGYLDPKYRDQFDEWRGGYKNPSQEHYAEKKMRNWDLDIRTKDQNSQGVGR
ncbi:MAG: hypothetical protein Ct9H300mP20_10230 [Gammaproteobacteria bacterium]|nr:MAG: hypothetical protein Ct9H300mP20_10230 [Gammaproteobacteria bacterium]